MNKTQVVIIMFFCIGIMITILLPYINFKPEENKWILHCNVGKKVIEQGTICYYSAMISQRGSAKGIERKEFYFKPYDTNGLIDAQKEMINWYMNKNKR